MDIKIGKSWENELKNEFDKAYFKQLVEFVKNEYATYKIFPSGKQIFSAFDRCSFNNTKVVIIGQDPYHGDGQANGLCFSVVDGIRKPPSLQNIFKEIASDLGQPIPDSGNLERWANQGVLMLNATLTVRAATPGSHQNKGWEEFTNAVIKTLNEQSQHLVFLLWGAYAQKKGAIIDRSKHLVLESAHPSPFAAHRGFFGSKHFSKCNAYLAQQGKPEIIW
ncbi:MAG: uracil-DNA glycosylase [Cyclobacteriaceae bacterium]|nr:uracil-DNA glycosylase [Cyclobacteriaceae bacterium]